MAQCSNCHKVTDDLNMWGMPDPYDGHYIGKFLWCTTCPPPEVDHWYESTKYNMFDHARFLGLTTSDLCACMIYNGVTITVCHKCGATFKDGLCGSKYVPNPASRTGSDEVYFCVDCFRKDIVDKWVRK